MVQHPPTLTQPVLHMSLKSPPPSWPSPSHYTHITFPTLLYSALLTELSSARSERWTIVVFVPCPFSKQEWPNQHYRAGWPWRACRPSWGTWCAPPAPWSSPPWGPAGHTNTKVKLRQIMSSCLGRLWFFRANWAWVAEKHLTNKVIDIIQTGLISLAEFEMFRTQYSLQPLFYLFSQLQAFLSRAIHVCKMKSLI